MKQFMEYSENWFKAFYINQAITFWDNKVENWNSWQLLLDFNNICDMEKSINYITLKS
jgi:hypothetical protein